MAPLSSSCLKNRSTFFYLLLTSLLLVFPSLVLFLSKRSLPMLSLPSSNLSLLPPPHQSLIPDVQSTIPTVEEPPALEADPAVKVRDSNGGDSPDVESQISTVEESPAPETNPAVKVRGSNGGDSPDVESQISNVEELPALEVNPAAKVRGSNGGDSPDVESQISTVEESLVLEANPSVGVQDSVDDDGDPPAVESRISTVVSPNSEVESQISTVVPRGIERKKCNLYEGRWEKDEEGRHPLYQPGSCPYVDDAFTCQENGRSDTDYLKWRWRPNDCELPRFNATDFLERLRGKRLMLVGDSMNRNQFESMLCVLREALPDKSKMYETRGYKISKGRGYFSFLFVDYKCTVEFVRSHFLAREGTRINGQGNSNPILEIDRIDKSAKRWKKANILVFNTGHWWTHGKTARGKNYYKEGGVVYPQFDATEAFKRAMRTWGKWIDENINHRQSKVFYRGYSSAHFRGGDWDSGGTCNGETEPVIKGPIIDSYPLKMKIVEEVISEMKSPVFLLNVTKLTNFRKDAHPSIYGQRLTPGQKVSRRRQDCSHWCLPGVPDAWNELIYATLVLEQRDQLG